MIRQLKLPEVAQRLGVSEKTARRYVKAGVLPSAFVGNAYRVSEKDLEEYLERARVTPGKAPAPPSSTQPPLNGFGEVRRADPYELALEAARRQATQDRQAANRALASGRQQTYFMRHENEAVAELSKYPADELAGALFEASRRSVALEDGRLGLVGAWRAFVWDLVLRWREDPPNTAAETAAVSVAMTALKENGAFDPANATGADEQAELQQTLMGLEELNKIADGVEKSEPRRATLRLIQESLSA